jgi:cytochrome c oxidase cbb3-type subunit I/II
MLDTTTTRKIEAMLTMGVPYDAADFPALANADLQAQSRPSWRIEEGWYRSDGRSEIIAMIAYLQRVGTDIKAKDH